MRKKEIDLSIAQPFSLKATALSHGWHECAPMSWCEGGQCFQLIDRIVDQPIRVSVVEGANSKRKVALRVSIEAGGEGLDSDAVDRLRERIGVVLGLGRDLAEFYGICEKHATLHVLPRIGAGRGLRSVCMAENVIKAICGTNVTWWQAVKMINRLGQLGPSFPHFVNLNAWPTSREILRAGESYLNGVCRVGYRADSILAFCHDVDNGDIDPDSWSKLAESDEVSSDELVRLMREVRGIGPASAHYLLSFLGRHDKISIDSATVAHVARTHMNGRKPTHKQIEKIYEPYGKWKHLVWWYEHWLTWETAKRMVHEAGLDG